MGKGDRLTLTVLEGETALMQSFHHCKNNSSSTLLSKKSSMLQKQSWLDAYQQLYRRHPGKSIEQKMETIISQLDKANHHKNSSFTILSELFKDEFFIQLISRIVENRLAEMFPAYPSVNRNQFLSYVVEKAPHATWFYTGKIDLEFKGWSKYNQQQSIPIIHEAYLAEIFLKFLILHGFSSQQTRTLVSKLSDFFLKEVDSTFALFNNEHHLINEDHPIVPSFYVRYQIHYMIGYKTTKQTALDHIKKLEGELKEKLPFVSWGGKLFHHSSRIKLLGHDLIINSERNAKLYLNKQTLRGLVKRYGNFDSYTFFHRTALANKTELDIIRIYNKELKILANKYYMVANFDQLEKVCYFARSSCINTIALKRQTTSKRVITMLKDNKHNKIGISYLYEGKKHWCYLMTFKDMRNIQRKVRSY